MKTTELAGKRVSTTMGSAMFIAWMLFLGPLGFLLLLGIAYSMVAQNLALGILCGLLLVTPLVLSAVWVPLGWSAVLRDQRTERTVVVPEAGMAPEAAVED